MAETFFDHVLSIGVFTSSCIPEKVSPSVIFYEETSDAVVRWAFAFLWENQQKITVYEDWSNLKSRTEHVSQWKVM